MLHKHGVESSILSPGTLTFLSDLELVERELRNDNALQQTLLKSYTNSTEKT